MENINFLEKLFSLDGKVAVVIGGGGYLCSEMARGISKAGAELAILDIRNEKAQKIAFDIEQFSNKKVHFDEVDVCNKVSLLNAKNKIIKKFSKVDILINGAGINDPTAFLNISLENWNAVINSQVTGTMLSCQVFGEEMIKKRQGSIINISSASAGPPLSKAFAYSVAKAGIRNLTMNLAREWADKNVRVNAIRPGFFPTEWNRKNFITKEREKDILNHTPFKRYGLPKELVGAVIWLASSSSSFVTGSEVTIDGGFSCMTI